MRRFFLVKILPSEDRGPPSRWSSTDDGDDGDDGDDCAPQHKA